jgi:predicted Holliday junction resolvase-like endonuclease
VFDRTQAPALSSQPKVYRIEMNSGQGGSMTDHKEAIKHAIQVARHSGLSSGEIIQIVEVEFTKTDETSNASKKAMTSEEVVWNPLTEDLKESKQ